MPKASDSTEFGSRSNRRGRADRWERDAQIPQRRALAVRRALRPGIVAATPSGAGRAAIDARRFAAARLVCAEPDREAGLVFDRIVTRAMAGVNGTPLAPRERRCSLEQHRLRVTELLQLKRASCPLVGA